MTCTLDTHRAFKADPQLWASLPPSHERYWRLEDGIVFELRDCPHCHSTLSIQIAGPSLEEAA